MFLRHNKRHKDGKEHRYWSVVKNRRLTGEDPAVLWKNDINFVRIEESFRTLISDLGLQPIFHQLGHRIEAHILISFLAYSLYITLEKINKRASTGLSARSVLERLSEIQMLNPRHRRAGTQNETLHQARIAKVGLGVLH